MSCTGLPSHVSRTAPPTQRTLSAPSAATNRARSSRRVHAARGSSAISPLPRQAPRKVGDDRGGDTPDAVAFPLDLDKIAHAATPFPGAVDVVRGVEKVGERSLEPRRDFVRVGVDRQVRRHDAEDWSDVIARPGHIPVARAYN